MGCCSSLVEILSEPIHRSLAPLIKFIMISLDSATGRRIMWGSFDTLALTPSPGPVRIYQLEIKNNLTCMSGWPVNHGSHIVIRPSANHPN